MATSGSESTFSTGPDPDDVQLANLSGKQLARLLAKKRRSKRAVVRLELDGRGSGAIEVPMEVLHQLLTLLVEMGRGNAVKVVSSSAELTTQQAADLLNVSRPFLVQQLESGTLPFRKVGAHRRVRLQDIIAYKQSLDANRQEALQELAAQAQELNMGY